MQLVRLNVNILDGKESGKKIESNPALLSRRLMRYCKRVKLSFNFMVRES